MLLFSMELKMLLIFINFISRFQKFNITLYGKDNMIANYNNDRMHFRVNCCFNKKAGYVNACFFSLSQTKVNFLSVSKQHVYTVFVCTTWHQNTQLCVLWWSLQPLHKIITFYNYEIILFMKIVLFVLYVEAQLSSVFYFLYRTLHPDSKSVKGSMMLIYFLNYFFCFVSVHCIHKISNSDIRHCYFQM